MYLIVSGETKVHEIITFLFKTAKTDFPGFIESLISISAIFVLICKLLGFQYSEQIDRIFCTKKQQGFIWGVEHLVTAVVIEIAIIAIVMIKQIYTVWLTATIIYGLFIVLLGIICGFVLAFCRKEKKDIVLLLVILSIGFLGIVFNSLGLLSLFTIFSFVLSWKSKEYLKKSDSEKKLPIIGDIDIIIITYLFIFIVECCIIVNCINTTDINSLDIQLMQKEEATFKDEASSESASDISSLDSEADIIFADISLEIICISSVAAIMYVFMLNKIGNNRNSSKVYIEKNNNPDDRWYIYSSIDSESLLCGKSQMQHGNKEFILISKANIIKEELTIKIDLEDKKDDSNNKSSSNQRLEEQSQEKPNQEKREEPQITRSKQNRSKGTGRNRNTNNVNKGKDSQRI